MLLWSSCLGLVLGVKVVALTSISFGALETTGSGSSSRGIPMKHFSRLVLVRLLYSGTSDLLIFIYCNDTVALWISVCLYEKNGFFAWLDES